MVTVAGAGLWAKSRFIRYGHIVRRFAPALCQGVTYPFHGWFRPVRYGYFRSGILDPDLDGTCVADAGNMNFATYPGGLM
ncbi:hypothetical protein BJV74DRAFT_804317 [Russula compacta]|nr:hypothetical protein BJV74DRAFT_804317 [Russula compacta]